MAISRARAEQDGQLGGGSPELKNRKQVKWEELEGTEITVMEIVRTKNADGEELLAIIPGEYPDTFMWCGTTISGWIKFYGADFIGTVIEVGPMTKTRAGRNCRSFTIV